jgi:hypothetical protein
LLALETMVIGIVALLLLWQVWRLVKVGQRYLDVLIIQANGILGSVKTGADAAADTVHQAKTTTGYVSTRTVKPVIEVYSVVNGATRFAQALFRPKPARPGGNDFE